MALEFASHEVDKDLGALKIINPCMYERINDRLDWLEDDHKDPRVRRHRLHCPKLWLIRVPAPDSDDYAILWETDGETTVVHYIGPDVFRSR
ncbi:MAG: hypothetical protein QG608_1890 [Actinomycetota bacterium]|nr:hypothetical protein [Actinomycetota bacterium]